MAKVGYSGTPLINKLGIKPGMKILLICEPEDYYSWLGASIRDQLCKKNEIPDLVHLFILTTKSLESEIKKLKPLCKKNSSITIWVSWYKKASGIATDVTEDVIRYYALKNEMVDVKVCAVSELWSGLKLVVPVSKRQASILPEKRK